MIMLFIVYFVLLAVIPMVALIIALRLHVKDCINTQQEALEDEVSLDALAQAGGRP